MHLRRKDAARNFIQRQIRNLIKDTNTPVFSYALIFNVKRHPNQKAKEESGRLLCLIERSRDSKAVRHRTGTFRISET